MTLVDRIEAGPLWLLGRVLIPNRVRRRACIARGTHRVHVRHDNGARICLACGTEYQP